MRKILLILLALVLITVPVSAALINVTIAQNAVDIITNNPEYVSKQTADRVTSYTSSFPSEFVFDQVTYIPAETVDEATINFIFTRSGTSPITATIVKHQTGIFSSEETCSIDGGTSRTWTYAFGNQNLKFVTAVAKGEELPAYFMCIPATEQWVFNALYFDYDIDTTADAYLELPSTITANPITSFSSASLSGAYSLDIYSKKMEIALDNEKAIAGNVTSSESDVWTALSALLRLIINTGTSIVNFAKSVAGFITVFGAISIFILAGKAILVIIGAYTILNAVLSVHDSDDMLKSIGKFTRREMKLFRFFMQFFLWMKDILKWW